MSFSSRLTRIPFRRNSEKPVTQRIRRDRQQWWSQFCFMVSWLCSTVETEYSGCNIDLMHWRHATLLWRKTIKHLRLHKQHRFRTRVFNWLTNHLSAFVGVTCNHTRFSSKQKKTFCSVTMSIATSCFVFLLNCKCTKLWNAVIFFSFFSLSSLYPFHCIECHGCDNQCTPTGTKCNTERK